VNQYNVAEVTLSKLLGMFWTQSTFTNQYMWWQTLDDFC